MNRQQHVKILLSYITGGNSLSQYCNLTHLFYILLCQEEEGGVCSEVLHSKARCEYSRIPGAQREGPSDRARHAPPTLLPHLTARRNPHPVEGWHCYSTVRSLKVALFTHTRMKVCLRRGALCLVADYVMF